jgi:transposase
MSMGKTRPRAAAEMWVATANFPTAASRPFYTRLNQRLAEHYFDDFVEGQWQPFYAEIMGRPGPPTGMYFRLLLIGYFIQRQATAVRMFPRFFLRQRAGTERRCS